MSTSFARALIAGFLTLWTAGALAQDVPALRDASPEEKARLQPLIESAKKEGA